jgi:hypothetical protein
MPVARHFVGRVSANRITLMNQERNHFGCTSRPATSPQLSKHRTKMAVTGGLPKAVGRTTELTKRPFDEVEEGLA